MRIIYPYHIISLYVQTPTPTYQHGRIWRRTVDCEHKPTSACLFLCFKFSNNGIAPANYSAWMFMASIPILQEIRPARGTKATKASKSRGFDTRQRKETRLSTRCATRDGWPLVLLRIPPKIQGRSAGNIRKSWKWWNWKGLRPASCMESMDPRFKWSALKLIMHDFCLVNDNGTKPRVLFPQARPSGKQSLS